MLVDLGEEEYAGVSPLLSPTIPLFEERKIMRHITRNGNHMHPNFFYPSIRAMFDIIHRIVVPQRDYEINLLNAHLLRHVWHLDKPI